MQFELRSVTCAEHFFQVVEWKDSSAFSAAFVLRALAEDLELFKEHDFTFLVEGEKPTLNFFFLRAPVLNCKSQHGISSQVTLKLGHAEEAGA